jgi:hypothetical protein
MAMMDSQLSPALSPQNDLSYQPRSIAIKLVKLPLLFYIFVTLSHLLRQGYAPACQIPWSKIKRRRSQSELVAAQQSRSPTPSQADPFNLLCRVIRGIDDRPASARA